MASMLAGVLALAAMPQAEAQTAAAQAPGIAQTAATQATAQATPQATAQGGTISGTVKAGPAPLPGVAITATNTLTGKKYQTTTDVNGAFSMTIPRNGRYVVKAELTGFALATHEVLLNAAGENGGKPAQVAEFGMQLASRAAAAEQAQETAATASTATRLGRGLQQLGVQAGALDADDASTGGASAGAQLPTLGGLAGGDTAGADSITVNGTAGTTNGLAGMSEDDIRQRVQDAIAQAQRQGGAAGDMANTVVGMLGGIMGGPGGFAGGGGGRGGRGGGGGGGGFRNFNPTQPHGSIFYQAGNNALNATPFSLTGAPTPKLGGSQNNFSLNFTGSPSIPGLVKANPKQFVFLSVTGQRNITPENFYATVPTDDERTGDFSGLTQRAGGTIQPVTLYIPAGYTNAGQPIPGNNFANVPGLAATPQALALLNYYPAPNIPVTGSQGYNYQTITTAGANKATAALRYVRNFGQTPQRGFGGGAGRRGAGGGQNSNAPPTLSQNINFNGSYSHTASSSPNVFLPAGGSTESTGYGITAGYTLNYGRLRNNASLNWNRSHSETTNFFTNTASDPLAATGVAIPKPVIGADPGIYYGIPSLSFTGFTPFTITTPKDLVNQTISFSDFLAYSHKKHNMRYGFDIRRVHADSIGGTNALGNLTFSGYATEDPACLTTAACSAQPTSGSGFADFLLGLPQQSAIQAGLFKTYLRANVWDWYAQDDWRALAGLTLNFGIRYEYFSPYIEKYNRLVNLDHNADFTEVATVQPGQTGPYSGVFPRSLVRPDRDMFAPRLAFAWRPKGKFFKETVIRGSYGLNYNTGQYATIAGQLASQPPFAVTQTNIQGEEGCGTLLLANAYGCSTALVQSNYSADKDYRLGHVQVWNLDIQRTLPMGIVTNIGYNGIKSGELDVLSAPNRTATGLLNNGAQAFEYENAPGYQRFEGLSVNVRKRLQKGISLQATYLYGHSIDDASSIGGTGSCCAQNPNDLNAEESNSAFDIRQQVSGNWVFELPFGPNRAFLAKGGLMSKALDGFSVSGTYAFQSGSYATPVYSGTVEETSTGVSNSLRPDRVFSAPIKGPRNISEWFNAAAFMAPPAGQYGTASRDSIEGPGVVSVNSSLSRTVELGGTRSFEARVTANNVFNTVQYSGINTTLNSPTFGEVSSVATMRTLTVLARYRF
jgi:hypothetical protein